LELDEIMSAVSEALDRYPDIDVLTITANGEPTLYPHLGELVNRLNAIKGKTQTLILSNGSTISDPRIRQALRHIDIVKLSLDCVTPRCFKRIDRMHDGIDIDDIKSGMLEFRAMSTHPLIIEILVVKGINDKPQEMAELNRFLLELSPDRVDLGSIDRPPAYAVSPVDYDTLYSLSMMFDPSLPIHITHRKHITSRPSAYSQQEILTTLAKRPLTADDIEILFDTPSQKLLAELVNRHQIELRTNNGVDFFTISSKNTRHSRKF